MEFPYGIWGYFSDFEYKLLVIIIADLVKKQPTISEKEISKQINSGNTIFCKRVSESLIKTIFCWLGWTSESPDYKNITKFEVENYWDYRFFNDIVYNSNWGNVYFASRIYFSSSRLDKSKLSYIKNQSGESENYEGIFIINLNGCIYKIKKEELSSIKNSNQELIVEYFEEVFKSGFIMKNSILYTSEFYSSHSTIQEIAMKYNIHFHVIPDNPITDPIIEYSKYLKENLYNQNISKPFLDEIIYTIDNSLNNKNFIDIYSQGLSFWKKNKIENKIENKK
ncbi:hypothetical protein ACTFIY_011664 [Dictyostelium cf. discoideum]